MFAVVIAKGEDTTKIVRLPEVEVIDTRLHSSDGIDYTAKSVLSKQQIAIVAPMQVSEILALIPNSYISNYGGLESMKTISLRGMGSMRTLVLLDGIPVNSGQNGSFDLNNIAISDISQIELMRGGGSAMFGGSAIGGVVNVLTEVPINSKLSAKLNAGSFGEFGGSIFGNVIFDARIFRSLQANFEYVNSKGDFPFTYPYFGEERDFKRENADYNNLKLSLTSNIYLDLWQTKLNIAYSNTDKGVPGAMLQGVINESDERSKDKIFNVNINSKRNIDNSTLLLTFRYSHDRTQYLEPSKTAMPESNFLLDDLFFNTTYKFRALNIQHSVLGTLNYSDLTGDMLSPDVARNVNRMLCAVGYNAEYALTFTSNIIKFNMGGRFDNAWDNAINRNAFSANAGILYTSKLPFLLRLNYSHNFRLPTFNEMYYRNYGTATLRPEKSDNFNVGGTINIFDYLELNVDAFHILTKDMITAVPTSPISWSAQNIARTEGKGVELTLALGDYFLQQQNAVLYIAATNISYTLQSTTDKSSGSLSYNKQLRYVPQEMFSYLFAVSLYKFEIGAKGTYSSFRYLQADNAQNVILPYYFVNDIFVNKKIKIANTSLSLRLDILNIFDVRYEIISNYIMPGRQCRISLGIDI